MTRLLNFDGPRGATRFALLYTALLSGGDGKGERSRATIRKEARLLDALDAISRADTPERRELLPDSPPVDLSQEDFDLLVTYADATPWTPRAARDAVDLQDWLSAAERRD